MVTYRADEAIWIFGGPDEEHLGYLQLLRLWPNTGFADEPTPEEVSDAVARFGRQRADDAKGRRARVRS